MEFNYDKETKGHYRDDSVAGKYHNAFARDKGWNALRFRIVANRERALVESFLWKVPHQRVLDLPTGTGKLAHVFKKADSWVKACDISENMLAIAKDVYKEIQYENVEFQICDAESVKKTNQDHFDLAVCLRLLHRVPEEVKIKILDEFADIADYLIVSFGVKSLYHGWRRSIRNMFFGGGTEALCFESFNKIVEKLERKYVIMDSKWVLPVLSQEIIFLVRARTK